MRQNSVLGTAFVVFACLAFSAQAYYVVMREGDKRCFSLDVPKDTLIVGNYECADATPMEAGSNAPVETISGKPFGISVNVKDPLDRLIYNKVHEHKAKFALTSHVGGQHQLCFQTNTSSWFNPATFRFHIDIKTGAGGVDYEKVAKREHLDGIALQVKRMNDRLVDIQNEQNYQRVRHLLWMVPHRFQRLTLGLLQYREAQFRDLSEDTNEKVVYFAIFQVLVVVGSAFWQIRHLRNFFRKKKLV